MQMRQKTVMNEEPTVIMFAINIFMVCIES